MIKRSSVNRPVIILQHQILVLIKLNLAELSFSKNTGKSGIFPKVDIQPKPEIRENNTE